MIKKEVFISSSISDLTHERNILSDAIEKLSTEYVCFSPLLSDCYNKFHFTEYSMRNDDSVDICLSNVRRCAYYVLLIKDEYRYQKKYGCSVTELEYKEAKKHKKPIYIFVFQSSSRKPAANAFVKRVSKDNWRYNVNSCEDVIRILKEVWLKQNSSSLVDENPPDGISIRKGESFTKTWFLKNTGNQVWRGYWMKHVTPTRTLIPHQEIVEMPDVYPGEIYPFKVNYYCKYEGYCFSKWKMIDQAGNEVFPRYAGIWVEIKIVGN